ncbi:MAG: TlpA disulfide reductase family protein [Bacteroidota bacterium]
MPSKPLFYLAILSFFSSIHACQPARSSARKAELKPGIWRAVLQSPGGELPFGLEIIPNTDTQTYTVFALNGKEKLRLDTAIVKQDSVHIPMALFDSEIVAHINNSTLTGRYIKRGINTRTELNFRAEYGKTYRFAKELPLPKVDVSGKWAVTFLGKEGKDTTQAVGIFDQKGNDLTGTFLTTTGDYRYLAGSVQGDSLALSCFDGTHVYLFKARLDGTKKRLVQGEFWSGKSGYETWTGIKNDKAALADANTLTYLKAGYDRIDFTFPNADGKLISLTDNAYKGKVVIVQVLGSWCPNCMDETNFLSPWYQKNKHRGVEIIGLAYEKNPDFSVSAPKLKRMIDRFNIDYQILLAGTNDKSKASETLPMLNRVLAFPTTIILDKTGQVRRIHTGFSGPGTGIYYTQFTEEFDNLINQLLKE